jgi:hypothetical protein
MWYIFGGSATHSVSLMNSYVIINADTGCGYASVHGTLNTNSTFKWQNTQQILTAYTGRERFK